MAGEFLMKILQGTTHAWEIEYKDDQGTPIDLTGFQGRGQIRLTSNSPVLAEFIVTIIDPILGKLRIELPYTSTENIFLKGKGFRDFTNAFYDIEIFDGTKVIRLLNGQVNISPEITKDE